MESKTEIKSPLKNKKVLVVPIKRKGRWLPDNHEASFLFKHSYLSLVVPKNSSTGELKDPLTEDERKWFESSASGLALEKNDLSIYRKDDNFWTKFRVKLDKNVLQLDLSNPMDYIRYKVLLVNSDVIAPTSGDKFNKATYRFALAEEGYNNIEKAKSAGNKSEAYKTFGRMMDSPTKMKDFLNVYRSTRPGQGDVPNNAKKEFLISEIEKIVEEDITGFLGVVNDPNYDTKLLIYKALTARALEREGTDFTLPGGTVIGKNYQEVITFFDNPTNSEEVLKIKARIETIK